MSHSSLFGRSFGSRPALVLLTAMACAFFSLPALAGSQARIVRLSDVQGSVEIDKNTGLGFESAFLNLPIMQGVQLRTRSSGRVEIEFEDGSTMRLGPNTAVEFSTLGLTDAGQQISVVNLAGGLAYLNWLGKGDFTLNFSREKVALDHPAHFRVQLSSDVARFAVFKGEVEVEGPSGKVTVSKKQMADFDLRDEDRFTLAKVFEEEPLDNWDKESIQYHEQYARNNAPVNGFGASDLGYYGNYTSVPGYGMMWQPFFTGVGWDPFMDGAWSWYPGYGSMFVSAYPWGWLPYRYGNWMFIPGFGWMWQPGGFGTWNALPRTAGVLPPTFHAPVAPTGVVKTVVVGKGGPVLSSGSAFRTVVRNGSAGMGIARGSVDNLRGLNHQVAKSGAVELHPTGQFGATSSRSSFGGGFPAREGQSSAMGSTVGHPSGGSSGGHASGGHH
ncbi:MAG TPA: FecR family protein [Candidatus Sulfotelmatobacter sp.]